MQKLVVFNKVTLDGYIAGLNGGFIWARSGNEDAEFNALVADNASGGGQLFSRTPDKVTWSYTKLVKSDIASEIRNTREESVELRKRTLGKRSQPGPR